MYIYRYNTYSVIVRKSCMKIYHISYIDLKGIRFYQRLGIPRSPPASRKVSVKAECGCCASFCLQDQMFFNVLYHPPPQYRPRWGNKADGKKYDFVNSCTQLQWITFEREGGLQSLLSTYLFLGLHGTFSQNVTSSYTSFYVFRQLSFC